MSRDLNRVYEQEGALKEETLSYSPKKVCGGRLLSCLLKVQVFLLLNSKSYKLVTKFQHALDPDCTLRLVVFDWVPCTHCTLSLSGLSVFLPTVVENKDVTGWTMLRSR